MKVEQWFERRMWPQQTVNEGIQYSLLSDDNRQCHPFVYCKEFVLDVTWATITGKPTSIYGFHFSPQSDPPTSLSNVRVLLRNLQDAKFAERVPKCLSFLNKLEGQLKFPKSTVEVCENAEKGDTFLFTCPQNWQLAPPLLSLLTLMLRIGMVYGGRGDIWRHAQKVTERAIKPYQRRDDVHLKSAWHCIQELIETKCQRFPPDRLANWPADAKNWAIHEYGGIVSLASGKGKMISPAWYSQPVAVAQ